MVDYSGNLVSSGKLSWVNKLGVMSPSCSGNFVVDYSIPEQVMMQSKLMKSRGISFHLFAESTVLSAASQRATSSGV